MDIKIRKLTPELAEDYAKFFDETPHNDSNNGRKCYCVTFCCDNVYHNGDAHWYDSAEERRFHGIKRVCGGSIQGYLAYCGDEVIAWCNANTKADCQEVMNYLRSVGGIPIDECHEGEKIKFIFCFTVAPKFQRMGVATKLLEYVCQDSAAEGFKFIEAHTKQNFDNISTAFRGHLAMYEKCGFNIHAEKDGKIVVRKPLKGRIPQ